MSTCSRIFTNEQMTKITNEFSRLGEKCYLENAGTSLYPKCLLQKINEDLLNNVYMNPHSDKFTKDCVDQIRFAVLNHFNTDSSQYSVIFTSGTTHALKLAVESFQFARDDRDSVNCGSFVYLNDNHTSVLGLREIAEERNADIINIPHEEFLNALEVSPSPPSTWKELYKNEGNTLLVYPAQSNFNGYKYPINCMHNIRIGCLNNYFIKKHLYRINYNWYILIDAASFVSTCKLDLSKYQPDFVCLSFYKIFGFPTGLGALIVKNDSAHVLRQKRYYGGGTVDIVLSGENYHVKRKDLSERFEDGTLPFLSIIALKHCFETLYKLIPAVIKFNTMETIMHHTFFLAKDLYEQLINLCHPNGKKAIVLYVDTDFSNIRTQGAIISFNVLRDDGSYIGYAEFQHMADLFDISIRTGCFCNSGSCQRFLNSTDKEMKDMFQAGHVCGDDYDLIDGRPTGCIRASFGYYNTYNDVDKLISMICKCFVKAKLKKPKRMIENFDKAIDIKSNYCNKNINSEYINKIINHDENHTTNGLSNTSNPKSDKLILREIVIFPIKSCGAYKINTAWKIGQKGFEYDRQWMIIKSNGVCLTQKNNTSMCMIIPKFDFKKNILILNYPGKQSISVPLNLKQSSCFTTITCQSKVCTDKIKGYDCGDEVADWISEALEISFLRLIRHADEDKRAQKAKNSECNDATPLLSLSNKAQFLLINIATIKWLKSRISDEIFNDNISQLTDRFRGNIIVETEHELEERKWSRIIIGKHEFKFEGPCTRCQMVCIDQQTGQKTVEPLRTISKLFEGKIHFGIYLSYIGTVDGSRDVTLRNYSPIRVVNDDISR